MGDLTVLLKAVGSGDGEALNRLFSLMYDDLHRVARARLRQNERGTLLDTTMLVHESYLRFLKVGRVEVTDRAHFLAYAARVMRSIIVDLVRQRHAERHGGGAAQITLNTAVGESVAQSETEIIRVGEAVDELRKLDGRLATVVEMRYFAGFTEAEIAEALGVTERTVRRDWEKARLILRAGLQ
jgi:RNA polymerase sigma factor (TIGR02999 family)